MVYLLAIASAVLYGAADFTGGLTSRRAATIPVVILSQLSGLASLAVALPLLPHASPTGPDLFWGGVAGLTGGIGVGLLYRALAIGRMSVVAPTTAVCAVAIPVVVSVVLGERPVPLALAGIILGIVSIVLVSRQTSQLSDKITSSGRPSGVGTAFASGVAIGFFFLALARTGPDAGMWPLLIARMVSVTLFAVVAFATRRSIRMPADVLLLTVVCGIVDMLANALYLLASRQGPLSIVVTLSSLYPASTVLLARVILKERLNLWQVSGVVCALTAIVLIVSGGRLSAQATATDPVDTAALQRLLTAEDARGTGPEGLAPLLDASKGQDSLLRRLAIRGLGRLQRPEIGRRLLAALDDPLPSVRAEAANALAQSMSRARSDSTTRDTTELTVGQAAAALAQALSREKDSRVVDALGESLGRIPFPDSAPARVAEDAIRTRLASQSTPGLVHGLYTLARARRATGNLVSSSLIQLRHAAVGSPDTAVRRLSLLTLAAADGLDSATATRAARDPDEEVRRTMLRGTGTLSPAHRAALVRRALTDPSRIVRIQAIIAARLGAGTPDCSPILAGTNDRDPYVALTAIDSLGGGCAEPKAAVERLRRLATETVADGPADHRWQASAHTLLALARLDRTAAFELLPRFARSERWELRQYAARAAGMVGDQQVLLRLSRDTDRNVQEAAIVGLAASVSHEADSVYLRALRSSGHQVVLAAATALKGSAHPRAPAELLEAFDSLSAPRSENARDPRMALLERIGELAPPSAAPRLQAYLADYDTTVAASVATILGKWTRKPAVAHPVPLSIRPEPLAQVFLRREPHLLVTMAPSSGGGSFTLQLFADEAPATVARVLRLVAEGFYNDKVFQRVEPNFVIQGGGPDANEYVGDSRFMRDELGLRTHARGTLGISSRGRDTGDGQWFINLVGNPLLDHEYTIFGRIVSGQEVAERILEGDRIARVDVVQSTPGRQ
jgi:cyclophilin family peptidyl-prolyl cis-trans isomerase/drug/metabolite transporter (DMT)-like permease/HEAT repeat protein